MENLGMLIYIYSIWDNVPSLLGTLSSASLISLAVLVAFWIVSFNMNNTEPWYYSKTEKEASTAKHLANTNTIKKYLKPTIVIMCITIFINTFIPKKEYLPIIFFSDSIATEFTQSMSSGKLAKLSELIDIKLTNAISELKQQNKENK